MRTVAAYRPEWFCAGNLRGFTRALEQPDQRQNYQEV